MESLKHGGQATAIATMLCVLLTPSFPMLLPLSAPERNLRISVCYFAPPFIITFSVPPTLSSAISLTPHRYPHSSHQLTIQDAKSIFEKYDTDGSETIDPGELEDALYDLGTLPTFNCSPS